MNYSYNKPKKKTKLKLSKQGKIIIGGIILAIIIIIYLVNTITYHMSDEYKIGELGYNDSEVQIILEKTKDNKEAREKIKTLRYNKTIPSLLRQKYFMFKNLDRYLTYAHANSDVDLKTVVAMVNVNRDYDFYTHRKKTDTNKNELMLVNKYYYLDKSFVPKNIVPISTQYSYEGNEITKEVYSAYRDMWNAANEKGYTLIVTSSYRDYESQQNVWDDLSYTYGDSKADDQAARAGHSEHQTGLALDIVTYNSYNNDFDKTDEFKWLQKNAHKYGFILRFPKGKENITGYNYESWHYRYVGVEVATKIHDLGITFDEYYAYYIEK